MDSSNSQGSSQSKTGGFDHHCASFSNPRPIPLASVMIAPVRGFTSEKNGRRRAGAPPLMRNAAHVHEHGPRIPSASVLSHLSWSRRRNRSGRSRFRHPAPESKRARRATLALYVWLLYVFHPKRRKQSTCNFFSSVSVHSCDNGSRSNFSRNRALAPADTRAGRRLSYLLCCALSSFPPTINDHLSEPSCSTCFPFWTAFFNSTDVSFLIAIETSLPW